MGKEFSKAIEEVTKATNKKGKLKGKNKKETKVLKAVCPHHKISKKGKIKPTTFRSSDGMCICSMCGAKFPARFYKDDDVDRIVGDMETLNNQSKYMSTAIGAGPKSIDYFCNMGAELSTYGKSYRKIREVADKRGRAKQKKRKRTFGGSSEYGSWSMR